MINPKLQTPIQYIKGVGPKKAELFARIGVESVEDLMWFMPRRYEDRSNLKPISKVNVGDTETIAGKIMASGEKRTRGRIKIFQAAIGDGTGVIYAVWFNQSYLKDYFKVGKRVILYGKITKFRAQSAQIQMNVPEYEILESDEVNTIHIGGIVPIYHATERLNQRFIRTIARKVLNEFINEVPEIVPGNIRTNMELLPIRKALWNIHFPETQLLQERARIRLAFDEFFLLQLGIGLRKHEVENLVEGISHKSSGELIERFQKLLPFKLTKAQERVLTEIVTDMQNPIPMNRLLQGDVGSGKTVVAVYALSYAVASGYQGAVMVPTEILARQHYFTLKELVEPLGIKIALLISELQDKDHKRIREEINDGDVDIIIGTHALIQEAVKYKKLGLVVIDEQHKFGVAQRALLRTKGKIGLSGVHPDVLVMTATPIPRSLALTVYGDMKLSAIDEMPPGRGKTVTYWITEDKLNKAYDFIRKEISKGRQAYIVYPLVKESEKLNLRAASDMMKKLQEEEFPKLRMGLIHGRLSGEEKVRIMKQFRDGKLHILVATTVIEVGIDISNATVMLVEHAERFGLAQLHQLRGRIGRSSQFSYCILQGNPGTAAGRRRLKAMEATIDGFRIAQEDLAIRGPGDFFGTRQHGMPELKIGNIMTDIGLMELARGQALLLLKEDPGLTLPEYRLLRLKVQKMFGDKLPLVSV